jgi:hypothetical protein
MMLLQKLIAARVQWYYSIAAGSRTHPEYSIGPVQRAAC